MNTGADSHRYRAYGLRIRSALQLPQLPPSSERGTDLEIRFGKIEHRPAVATSKGSDFWAEGDRACHRVTGVGAFLVTAGREILVDPEPEAAPEHLRLPILGPALALALHQRGTFVLHASSVGIDGAGVAFAGRYATGKSTMAAALRQLEHRFTGDDLAAVSLQGQSPSLLPGYPQHKLWPDAALTLGFSPSELPRVHPDYEKRALRFAEGFDSTPLPLRRMYVLAIGDSVALEELSAMQSFEEFMCHWYGARFDPAFVDIGLRDHFMRASQLTREVPVRRLIRPPTLNEDGQLSKAIEREILRDLEGDLG